MADFSWDGLDDLTKMMDKLANVPRAVVVDMLDAGAQVIIKAQRQRVPKNTGKMASSIAGDSVRTTYDGGYKYIYPHGVHHVSKKSRYRRKGDGKAASRTVQNAEVGFIHEYGAPGRNIKASQWVHTANEAASAEVEKVQQNVLDDWTDKQ